MEETRRNILKSAGIGALAIGLGANNFQALFAKEKSESIEDFDVHRLSNAVVKSASRVFAEAFNRAQAGSLTSGDVQAVVATATILFSHFEEIGVNASTDRKFRERGNDLLAFQPSREAVELRYARLFDMGFRITSSQVDRMMSFTLESKRAALELVDRIGIRGVQQKSLEYLESYGSQLLRLRGSRIEQPLLPAAFAQASPEQCRQMQSILVSIEIAIGMYAAACGLGVYPACIIVLGLQSYATMLFIQLMQAGCFN